MPELLNLDCSLRKVLADIHILCSIGNSSAIDKIKQKQRKKEKERQSHMVHQRDTHTHI